MTTIISRVFPDTKSATQVADRLNARGVPSRDLMVISNVEGDDLSDKLDTARIDDSARAPYTKAVQSGHALLVIHATYKPLTAATIVRDTLAKYDTIGVGDVVEDYFVPDGPQKMDSILRDHPLLLSKSLSQSNVAHGPITKGMGYRMTKPHKESRSAIAGGGFMSRKFWPMPLLSTKMRKSSVISGGRYMSRAFWPMALLSNKSRSNSVIKGGGQPLSRALGWPPVS